MKQKIKETILQIILLILLILIALIDNYKVNVLMNKVTSYEEILSKLGRIEEQVSLIETPIYLQVSVNSAEPLEEITYEVVLDETKYDESDLRLLASLIYCEAGNQCIAGQQAVGIVVMNRVIDDRFGNTIEEVIYTPGQFTPAQNGNLEVALEKYDNNELPDEAIFSAIYALDQNTTVEYQNKEYDIADYLYFNGILSNPELQIQDHYFK